ncbi:MAG: AraC family transcriptional regulator [Microbacterium sp.]
MGDLQDSEMATELCTVAERSGATTGARAVSVTTRNVDRARAVGGAVYHPHAIAAGSGSPRFGMRLRGVSAGPMTTGTLEYLSPVRVVAAPFVDWYQVNLALTGAVLTTYGGRELVMTSQSGIVHGPDAPSSLEGWRSPARVLGLKVARRDLELALMHLTGRRIERAVEFKGGLDAGRGVGLLWTALVRRASWWSSGPGRDDDPIGDSLRAAILAALLHAAPHEFSRDLEPERRGGVAAAHLALAFMHGRVGAVTVGEAAARSHIGVRALEKRFLLEWGSTPAAMLTEIRLQYARRELEEGRASASIAEVATRWGFGHPGRFASRYAERFGETPSRTRAFARRHPAA